MLNWLVVQQRGCETVQWLINYLLPDERSNNLQISILYLLLAFQSKPPAAHALQDNNILLSPILLHLSFICPSPTLTFIIYIFLNFS